MPFLDRSGYRIFYTVAGDPDATPLILSHSLGATSALWEPQLSAFSQRFRIIRYDHPGHGRSSNRTAGGTLSEYATDVIALMDELDVDKAHFCGLSLGGMVGIRLGALAGHRFHKLILSSTTAKIEDPTLLKMRINDIRRDGLTYITDSVLEKWLSQDFRSRHAATAESVKRMFLETTTQGYADTAEMICTMDLGTDLKKITNEVMVIFGLRDKATPPAWNRTVAEAIAGAQSVGLDTSHLINIEAPLQFTEHALDFFM